MRRLQWEQKFRRGFTMIEVVTVMTIVALMMAIVAPRFRISEAMEVQLAARQLAQDLDFARARALATRASVRVSFESNPAAYAGYLDDNDDGTISESDDERIALRGFGHRELSDRLEYARGSVPEVSGVASGGAISFSDSRVDFDSRGLVTPMGASGAVYIRHKAKPEHVAAVAVTAAGNVRIWTWHEGQWK